MALDRIKNMSGEERARFEDRLLLQMPDQTSEREECLYGCLREDTSSLDACIPSCLAGYKFLGTPSCTKRVYVRDSATGQLTLKNDIKTDRAYIYLDESDVVSASESKFLRNKHGVRELYVYRKLANSKDYEHIETLNLLVKKTKKVRQARDDGVLVGALVLIFILFIFILVAMCLVHS